MSKPPAVQTTKAAIDWWMWGLLGGLLLGFAAVRLLGVFNDLWLDEIWSVRMVESIKSPFEILTSLRHDNNHPLNSLFIYYLLPADADWTFRLLSWFSGSLSVWLAALIARKQYRQQHPQALPRNEMIAGILTAILVGASYLLIHYSSEARGYAPAVMFSLLAIFALQHAGEKAGLRWAMVYWLACGLGLLAHLATVQVLIAGLGFSLLGLSQPKVGRLAELRKILGWHLLPWLGFGVYYIGFIRKIEIGGGPDSTLMGVLVEAAAYVMGLPVDSGVGLALPLILVLVGMSLWLMGRVGGWRNAFLFGLLIFVTPALGIVFSKFNLLYPRYFLLNATFALVVSGYGLTCVWLRGGWARILVGLGLICFVVGNAVHVTRLVQFGRGQYRSALREIAQRTPTSDIAIGSDHDFRNQVLVDYYRGVVAPKSITYHPMDQRPPWGVDWLLLHRLDDGPTPPEMIADARGNRYVREMVYPHAALSGWDWFIYRRQ
jgi:hypothetical protein